MTAYQRVNALRGVHYQELMASMSSINSLSDTAEMRTKSLIKLNNQIQAEKKADDLTDRLVDQQIITLIVFKQ